MPNESRRSAEAEAGRVKIAEAVARAVSEAEAPPLTPYDAVGNASHYQGEIECIDAIRVQLGDEGFTAFLRGTIARYIWRLGQKDAAHLEAVKVGWYTRALESHLKRISK